MGLHSMPPAATTEAYRHFVSVMTTAAKAVFGLPITPNTMPRLVSSAAKVLHALVKAHPHWWLNALLTYKVVAACKTVRRVWDVVGLERSLEVIPLARPKGVTGPSKTDYRRLMWKPFTSRIEPPYASGRLVPPEVQAAGGLDPFRARHLHLILRCTEAELYAVIPWRVDVMPPLAVTIDSTRRILRKSRRSTPFLDLVEYCIIEWLHDDQLQWVVSFHGCPPRAIVHGDFYALLAKIPHGPIVNALLLLKFTTMWKLVGAHIADQYVPLLARRGVLPCTQFALHPSSSVADLLRVLQDYMWFRFFRHRLVSLVHEV